MMLGRRGFVPGTAVAVLVAALVLPGTAVGAPLGQPSVVTAFAYEYAPGDQDPPSRAPLEVAEGGSLVFINLDPLDYHTVTSVDLDENGQPIFGTPSDIGMGQFAFVDGVDRLPARDEPYVFTCVRHTFMIGELSVVPGPLDK